VFYLEGNLDEAEQWYLDALSIQERTLGRQTAPFATTLNNLGLVYRDKGNYEKAEPLLLEAKNIREKVLGKEHPHYSGSLSNLAILYADMIQYEKAERLYQEALILNEKAEGKTTSDYAGNLINLANLYSTMGHYEKGEPLYLEAKAIFEDHLNNITHRFYHNCLINLAILYENIGLFEKAEILYLKVLEAKSITKNHPDYASVLSKLAGLYMITDRLEQAEKFYLEANDIKKKIYQEDSPVYLGGLVNLAGLYRLVGDYDKALPLLLNAKKQFESSSGNRDHPFYLTCLNTLGNVYWFTEKLEDAERVFLESKAVWEKAIETGNLEKIVGIKNVASFFAEQGRFSESEPLLIRYFEHSSARLLKSTTFLSEQELAEYSATFLEDSDMETSQLFFRRASVSSSLLPALIFNRAIFNKGFLLTAAARLNIRASALPESAEINRRLQLYRQQLATGYADPDADQNSMIELEGKANTAEKELARMVAGYSDAIRQINWQDVQQALKKEEAAIEFIHFWVLFPEYTDSILYAALLLRPGAEQPDFIPLFEEKTLDSLLIRNTDRNELYVKSLYSLADRSARPLGKPQKTLYDLLWKPLEKHLDGAKTIYFAPSGLLHRLNLAAIPINLDSVLADRYQLVELGSTRQLVTPATVQPAANDAVLFGGIAYDADTTAMSQANAAFDSISIVSRGELSFSYTDSALRAGTWSALPFTDREVGSVDKTLKTAGFQSETRRGFAATEEAFKAIGAGRKTSPRVLHLATHGFFFPDPKSTSARFETSPTFGATEPIFKMSDHPMIRSGLLLAGGNHAWATGKPLREGMDDGILTAYEISQMNLSNTELVVLSACETGLGDIQGNEGVYGLQRAFKIAGAKYLIMSLWQVPDKQTSLLMTTFYKKWLEDKMEIPEAFRAAQKELREAGLDPYYWAGFVLVE
jgi:CHAT domain-containing protein